jgi:hypothetical protein
MAVQRSLICLPLQILLLHHSLTSRPACQLQGPGSVSLNTLNSELAYLLTLTNSTTPLFTYLTPCVSTRRPGFSFTEYFEFRARLFAYHCKFYYSIIYLRPACKLEGPGSFSLNTLNSELAYLLTTANFTTPSFTYALRVN